MMRLFVFGSWGQLLQQNMYITTSFHPLLKNKFGEVTSVFFFKDVCANDDFFSYISLHKKIHFNADHTILCGADT